MLHSIDRALHAMRRRRATEFLEAHAGPRPFVFMCRANRCRSPFAAAGFVRELPDTLRPHFPTTSAAFFGAGQPAPAEAIAAAARVGIDLSDHLARAVSVEMFSRSTLPVVMSAEQARWLRSRFGGLVATPLILGDLDPLPIDTREIIDPWNGDAAAFDAVYTRIDRCVRVLAEIVTTMQR